MEPQGLSFGQPVSIVCPVIRSPQSAAREQQRGSVPEPAGGPADEPRRRQGDGAADSTSDWSSVLRTVAASQPSAGDADNSRDVMYVGNDGYTPESRTSSRADDYDDDDDDDDDGPPAAEEAPARVDPLMVLCQAAQHQSDQADPEQRVPVGPEVHFGELSATYTPPLNTDDGQYGGATDGHGELPMEEHDELPTEEYDELPMEGNREVPMEENHELPMEGNHELPMEDCPRVPVEDEQHQELPVQEQHHKLPVQDQHHKLPVKDQHHQLPVQVQQELTVQEQREVPVQKHYQVPAASAPTAVMVPLRLKGVEVECAVRQIDLAGSALLSAASAAARGALTVAVAPGNEQEGAPEGATQKLYFLYPESPAVYAAPVPQVDSTAVTQGVYVAPVSHNGSTTVSQEVYVAPATQNGSTTVAQPTDARMVNFFDRAGEPLTSGRDSPAVLHFSTQHGIRQLHLSLNCDGETCCRSQDTPTCANDSTVQISETAQASLSATVQEPAAIEYRPQNAEGESQKPEKDPDVTVATPDSTGDAQTAVGQDPLPENPVQEETTECTSDTQPNSNTTKSKSSGPASATQDGTATTDTSPVQTADENLNNSEAKRDDTVDDSAPDLSCANSEVKNPCVTSLHGRRRKNPVRHHIVSATPSNGRKPVSRRLGVATSDSVVSRGRRQPRVADPTPVKELEKQQARDNRHSTQELIRAEEAATDASERVNAASGTRSTVRKDGGRRRGGSRGGKRRRRPVAAVPPSPSADSTAAGASAVGEHDRNRDAKPKKRLRDTAARKAAKASRRREEWMLQPLCSPLGQDAPLRLLVKRRTLTVSESSDLPSEYAVKEAVKSPLGIQVEDMEKSKPGLRRRRHSTNDCQSNHQESQMNNSLHFSQNVDQPDFSVQWRKRRKPATRLNVNSEDDISNDADDDNDDDDEDWVPNNYKQRKSFTGGHNNLSRRMNLAKRRKSVASGTDELLQIPCTETVATMTESPERLAEKDKEESLIPSTDTLPVSESNKTTVAKIIVTALTDTSKSSVEEHVPNTSHDSMASHSTTKYNQTVVSRKQHKVACNADESYQEPAPKKYKKAWQELWSAQQNDEQAEALPMPHRTEELPNRDEGCTRDLTQQSTADASPALSSHVVPQSSSSHMNQQQTSDVECKDKALETGAISSGLTEDPHNISDDSVETLSDTTTDESDNETGPVTLHKCRSVVPHQGVPVHTLHHPGGLTSQQPQGVISEGLYVVNGRTLRVRVQEVEDGPLDPALSQVCSKGEEFNVENKKHGSQNNDVIVISDSDDDCPRNNSGVSTKFQGRDEKKVGDSNDNDDITILSDLSLAGPWPKKDILYGTELRQKIYSKLSTEMLRKKKEILFKKYKEEFENRRRSFNAAHQGRSSISQITEEAYLWGIISQLISTEVKYMEQMAQHECDMQGPDRLHHSSIINLQSNICPLNDTERSVLAKRDQKKSVAYLLESDEKSCNSNPNDSLKMEDNLQQFCEVTEEKTEEIPLNNCQNKIQQSDTSKSKLSGAEETAVKEVQSLCLEENNSLSVPCSNSLRGGPMTTKIDSETENVPMVDNKLATEDDSKQRKLCDVQKLAVLKLECCQASDNLDKKQADGMHRPDLNNVRHETCKSSGDVIMKEAVNTHAADTNNVAQKLCATSSNIVMKLADDIPVIDLDIVAKETCETSSDIVMKQADKTLGDNLNDVAVKESFITDQSPAEENSESSAGVGGPKESTMELYSDDNRQQHFNIDKQHSLNENIAVSQSDNKQNTTNTKTENATDSMTDPEVLIVKMKLVSKSMEPSALEGTDVNKKKTDCSFKNSNGLSPEADCKITQCEYVTARSTTGGCNNEQNLLPNVHKSVNLKKVSNVCPEADLFITIDTTCEGHQSQPSPGLSSSNLTDINLKEKVNVRNSPNLPQVTDSSVTVDGGCEVSNAEVPAAISSGNLIEQLVQSQQNSRVFDPLVSLIKTRPIVGDFALRYEMMVKKELARLHEKEAKQKEKRNKKKTGSIGDSKMKKKKKKEKKKLFPGKGFCGFGDNDEDLDGCGPGKGGFSGGTLTFTAIVSSFSSDCVFPLYKSFLNKGINICKRCKAVIKWSKGLSHTLRITCWLLYFDFQLLYPFTI